MLHKNGDKQELKRERNRRRRRRDSSMKISAIRRKEKFNRVIRIRSEKAVKESLDRLFATMIKNVPVVRISNDVPEHTKSLIHPRLEKYAKGYWRQLIVEHLEELQKSLPIREEADSD